MFCVFFVGQYSDLSKCILDVTAIMSIGARGVKGHPELAEGCAFAACWVVWMMKL